MKLYSPRCMDNSKKNEAVFPWVYEYNRHMKLYYPVCMDKTDK